MSNSTIPEPSGPFRYWAFLSYSHADEKFASWLHREIETYRGHARLVGSMNAAGEAIPKQLSPIFRDRDELAAATNLPQQLQDALLASKFLIVICSRRSATSTWVNQEVLRFKALGRSDRILAVVVDGEPWASRGGASAEECFPQALRYEVGASGTETECVEPLAADARPTGDGKHSALVKIVAAMLGVRFDELRQRDLERRRRNRVIATAVFSVITLSLLTMLVFSIRQRMRAAEQAKVAKSEQILSQAINARGKFRVDEAILLALAAYDVVPTFGAKHLMGQLLGDQPALKRYLAGTGAAITSIAFDASGHYAATSNKAGFVTVWDVERGIAIGSPLQGNDEEIPYVCFAGGDPERLAAVTVQNNLITWEHGKRSGITQLADPDLTAVHCASDPVELLGVDASGRILAWDLARPNASGNERGRVPAGSFSFTRTGAQMAAVDDHSITITNVRTGSSRKAEFADPRLHINTSQINDDASLVATVDSTSTLRIWKTDTGKPTAPWPLQLPGLVISLQFSPDSKSLALGLADGLVLEVASTSMQFSARMRASSTDDGVLPVEFSPNGEVLLSGFTSGKLVEWHPASSSQYRAQDQYSPCPGASATRISMGRGSWLGSSCNNGTVVSTSLSAPSARSVVSLGGDPRNEVGDLQLGADGKRGLFIFGNKVGLVDFSNASIEWKSARNPADSFDGLARASQAVEVGALTSGGELVLWDMVLGSSHSVTVGSQDENWSLVALDAGHGAVATVSRGHVFVGTIVGNSLTLRRLPGEADDGGGFSFLNDGLELVGLSRDGKVLKWSLSPAGSEPTELTSGTRAHLVSSSPTGNVLAVALDSTIQLLDPQTGNVLLESPMSDVHEFSFNPEGTKLAVISGGAIVTVLDLDMNRWVKELCAVANASLSLAQWSSTAGSDVQRPCSNLPAANAR